MKKLKEFKKLYDQVKTYDEFIPGWQNLTKKQIETMYLAKLKQLGKAVTKR